MPNIYLKRLKTDGCGDVSVGKTPAVQAKGLGFESLEFTPNQAW